MWHILAVPHPSDVPKKKKKSARSVPKRQLPVLMTEIRHLALFTGICFERIDKSRRASDLNNLVCPGKVALVFPVTPSS
jgi:hypothetical protein